VLDPVRIPYGISTSHLFDENPPPMTQSRLQNLHGQLLVKPCS